MFTRLAAAMAFLAIACGASGCCNGCCGTGGFGQPAYGYGAAPTATYGNYAYAPAPGGAAPSTYSAPMAPMTQPAAVAAQPQAVRY